MRLLNAYIRKQIIIATLAVAGVVLGIESFLEFVTQLSDIGTAKYGLLQAIKYVPLQMPAQFYQLFPMIGFLGCLIGLGRLASSSELIVMRSAGVSITQIAGTVVKVAVMMIMVVTFIGEVISPTLQSVSNDMKEKAIGHLTGLIKMQDIWLWQGKTFVHIQAVLTPTLLLGLTFFDFNNAGELIKLSSAQSANLINKKWQLSDAKHTLLSNKNEIVTTHSLTEPMGFTVNAHSLYQTER